MVVKGKTSAIDLWEPLPDGDPRLAYIQRYCDAYAKLEEGAMEAKAMFEALAKDAPDDASVAFHIERIQEGELTVFIKMDQK